MEGNREGEDALRGGDKFGPSMEKDDLLELMKETKRIDDKEPTIKLNDAMIETFHKELLGKGAWTKKYRTAMKDKYWLSRAQRSVMEAPTMRGTKIYTAVKGFDFRGLGKTLLGMHEQVRDVVKLGLREYEIVLKASKESRDWAPVDTHDQDNKLLPEYTLAAPDDIPLNEADDLKKIADLTTMMKQPGGAEKFAGIVIQQRRALRQHADLYAKMFGMFQAAQEVARVGMTLQKDFIDVHWDLLQNLAQLDLSTTAARNTSVEKFLTARMKQRLDAEMADPNKRRRRDEGNCLLAPDLDKLVGEECKTNSRLNQVSFFLGRQSSSCDN